MEVCFFSRLLEEKELVLFLVMFLCLNAECCTMASTTHISRIEIIIEML